MPTLQQLITAAKFDLVNENITEANFPFQPIRGVGEIIHFDRNMTSDEAIAELDKKGLIPANLYELLEYAKDGWDGKDWIVALGSFWVLPDGHRYVPYLDFWCDGRGRGLDLHWCGSEWYPHDRVLAVRKPLESGIVGAFDSGTLGVWTAVELGNSKIKGSPTESITTSSLVPHNLDNLVKGDVLVDKEGYERTVLFVLRPGLYVMSRYDSPKFSEVTLAEIAAWKGVPVGQVKIIK